MEKPVDTDTTASKSTTTISVNGIEYVSGSTLTNWVAERQIVSAPGSDARLQKKELLGMIQLPKTYYASLLSTCDDIMEKFDKLFYQRYNLKLIITRKSNGYFNFALSSGAKLTMYTDESAFGSTMKLKYTVMAPDKVDARMEGNTSMYTLATVGTELPRLDNIHALYVYADIVEPQHVGDVMAPLIGYVNVTGKPGDRICHTCNPPIYLPVDKSYIDVIRVRITDERGDDVRFPDLLEHVVLRLHFRKVQLASLF
jgi:hypothetical protein